ncbi:unnamed protein product [Haemonchus placei]|uniref:HMG box domain-containing protein n=1 Tax=Haemonchus placei TaxID=6290 RepID=A0A0N4W1C0_HAEPC|nr:unnamed protein product [Haemonchus placei]
MLRRPRESTRTRKARKRGGPAASLETLDSASKPFFAVAPSPPTVTPPKPKFAERCGPARIKWWRLKEKEKESVIVSRILLPAVTTVDETWKNAVEAITRVARSELGMTKPGRRKIGKQTWLRTDHVRDKDREKKKQYHAFLIEKTADNWQRYQIAKKEAKKAVASEKAAHYADLNKKFESRDGERYIYRLAKTRHRSPV